MKLTMPKKNGITIVESDNSRYDVCYAIKKITTGQYWCMGVWGEDATTFKNFEDAHYKFICIAENERKR